MSTPSKRKSIESEGEGEREKGADEQIIRVFTDETDRDRPEVTQTDKNNLETEKSTRINEEENNTNNNTSNSNHHKKAKTETANTNTTENNTADDALEDFEVGASPFVTQTEATQQYCLPAGTLAVCTVVEVAPWSRIPEARAILVPRDD